MGIVIPFVLARQDKINMRRGTTLHFGDFLWVRAMTVKKKLSTATAQQATAAPTNSSELSSTMSSTLSTKILWKLFQGEL